MRLREFAPSPERDDSDEMPNQLLVLANRWWNATDKQPQIEHVLNSLGWSIQQVESEDDAVQLQHRDGTTYFISADDFDPDLFEISDELRRNYLHRADQHVSRRMDRMARVRDRLNKGYEIYHADRPAGSNQIVDRFDADTPALARQYYEKFIQNYESDVDFDLRLRRSTGIIEDIEGLPARINKTADVDGIRVSINTNEKNASAYATSHGRRLGYAEFDRDGNVLVPYDLAVSDEYRGQGIAAVIYDYVKSLGFTIKASPDQTDDGKYF
jgi:GNAT superfamily N-acetyltransferase